MAVLRHEPERRSALVQHGGLRQQGEDAPSLRPTSRRRPARGRLTMATFVLIHGAGDSGWYWHLVEAELRRRGHDVVAPDLAAEALRRGRDQSATPGERPGPWRHGRRCPPGSWSVATTASSPPASSTGGAGPAGHHRRRDRRQPPRRPQPPQGAGRPPGGVPGRAPGTRGPAADGRDLNGRLETERVPAVAGTPFRSADRRQGGGMGQPHHALMSTSAS
jgi:hypothetical protein